MRWKDLGNGRLYPTWQVVFIDLGDTPSGSDDSTSSLFRSLINKDIGYVHTCGNGRKFERAE